MSSYNRILGFDRQTGSWQNVACNSTGALYVTGISSGGGVSSDVTVLNFPASQAVTGTFYQSTQPVSIETLPSVEINNFPASQAVTGTFFQSTQPVSIETLPSIEINNFPALQETNDAAAIAVLENIYIATGNMDINTTPIAYSPVHLDLETQGATAWADSTLAWFAPLNHEQGWQYDNTTAGGANLYFYGNTALVPGGVEPDFTLGSLMNMSFVGNYRLLLNSNPNKKFYLALTTKPTGTNDFYPGVFHSRKVWELPSSTVISKGASYLFYAMDDITSFRRDLDHKQMTLALSNGDCDPSEIVQFMSINVDSGTAVNQFSGIVKEAYFSTAGGTNRHVVFDNSIAHKAELNLSQLTVGMGTLQVSMGGFTFNGDDELLVTKQPYVDIRSSGIDLTHTTNASKECLDVQVNNITACDTGAVVISSGSVSVSGDVGLVAGTQVNLLDSTVGLVVGTTVGITGDVAVISGATALSVTETNPLTGFATETTLDAVKTQTDKLTFIDVDEDLNNLKVIDNALNAQLAQFSFFTNEDTVTDLRVKQMGPVEIENVTGGTLTVSGSVGIIADQSVAISGSVQTHCFASSNGSDWHHLASDANGRINTNSRTHDGQGNNISSTSVSGTESYTGLDVVCKGAVSVQNVSGAQLAVKAQQYGSYGNVANNVASILPSGVTAGIDVSAWSYFVGAYEDYNGATVGDIKLEYSFDNITYYTLFNTQIFPSGTAPRRANINKQDIPAVNYIRLRNGTSSTLSSVTLTLLGGSLS